MLSMLLVLKIDFILINLLIGFIPKLIQETDTFRYIGDPRKAGRRTCDEKNLEYLIRLLEVE